MDNLCPLDFWNCFGLYTWDGVWITWLCWNGWNGFQETAESWSKNQQTNKKYFKKFKSSRPRNVYFFSPCSKWVGFLTSISVDLSSCLKMKINWTLLVAVIISWENRVLQCTILTHCGVTDFMKIMTWGPRCCWHMGRETERGFTSLKGTWCPQTHFSHWNAHRQLLSQSTELDNISYFHTHLLAGL